MSNVESIKLNKIAVVTEQQSSSSSRPLTSSNKTTKNDQHEKPEQKTAQNKSQQHDSPTMILPTLPMTLGGVSTSVKPTALVRSATQLQSNKTNGITSSKFNSPVTNLNMSEFEDYQKVNYSNPPKNHLKIKSSTGVNKANLSYLNENANVERSNSNSTSKTLNTNGIYIYRLVHTIEI